MYYYSGDLAGNTEEIRSFTVTVEERAKATVTLKRITSWKTLARNKTYVAKGTVSPAHATDDPNRVEIQAFKRGSNKKFKYVKTYLAKYGATIEGRTAYSARVKLTSKGEWRLRAVHNEDEYGTAAVGTFDYVTVK